MQYENLEKISRSLICELTVTRSRSDNGVTADVPERPSWFKPMKGSYAAISAQACRMNKVQEQSGFSHYIFAPEPVRD